MGTRESGLGWEGFPKGGVGAGWTRRGPDRAHNTGKGPEAASRDRGGRSSLCEGSRPLEPGEWAGERIIGLVWISSKDAMVRTVSREPGRGPEPIRRSQMRPRLSALAAQGLPGCW